MENWPHAPLHWFKQEGCYMITGATYLKQPLYGSDYDLSDLQDLFFDLARKKDASLHAWSFFPNHYHLVIDSPKQVGLLRDLIREFHSISARELNQRQNTPGRKVWFQYWDTNLTYQRSYFARLNYVNQKPVHHGVVAEATNYRWCSASWFEANAKRSFVESVKRFGTSRINVKDDF
jgi:putative transposase